jgi:hypothetical protein
MPEGRYLIKNPVLVLFEERGRRLAETVPVGAILTVDRAAFSGNKLIEVAWNGRRVIVFVRDLNSRAEKVA